MNMRMAVVMDVKMLALLVLMDMSVWM